VQRAGRLDCLRKSFDLLMTRVENGSDERGEHQMTQEGKTWRRLVREASRGRKVPVPQATLALQRVPTSQHEAVSGRSIP